MNLHGYQTFCVVAKIDTITEAYVAKNHACSIILNRVVPLRLGYVGVKNRS